VTRSPLIVVKALMISSASPSLKYSFSLSELILVNGRTAIDGACRVVTGRFQMPIGTMAAAMGGNVRVGMEDSLWDSPGKLATSNADQVRRIRTILEALSLDVATPGEARELLKLKGKANVNI